MPIDDHSSPQQLIAYLRELNLSFERALVFADKYGEVAEDLDAYNESRDNLEHALRVAQDDLAEARDDLKRTKDDAERANIKKSEKQIVEYIENATQELSEVQEKIQNLEFLSEERDAKFQELSGGFNALNPLVKLTDESPYLEYIKNELFRARNLLAIQLAVAQVGSA